MALKIYMNITDLFTVLRVLCKKHRVEILKKLHRVLESSTLDPDDFYFEMIDPDPSYALTFDNLVKMLAIQMRFRYLCKVHVLVVTCLHGFSFLLVFTLYIRIGVTYQW